MKVLFTLLSMFVCLGAGAQNLKFSKDGVLVKTISVDALKKKKSVESVVVMEPHVQKEISFDGINFDLVLDEVFGKEWRQGERLLVTCLDGYQPIVAVSTLVAGAPFLSFGFTDKTSFSLNLPKKTEPTSLAPFYLIWRQKMNLQQRLAHRNNWPYQVTQFDLISKK